MPNNEIKIRDKRKLNPLTKKPINPRRDLKSMNADANMIKNIYNTARDYKLDPNLMLAIGLQESNLGKTDANNPFRVNAIYHGISEDPMAQGAAIFRDKYNKNPKMSEAHRIQAYNGLTKKTRANPDYGNQVISLRDSVIKQSPELQNYMTKLDSAYNAYNQPIKKRPQTNLKKLNPFQQALFGLTGSTFENGGKIKAKNEKITPQTQTQIDTSSQIPITLGMSSPDSSTGKRRYRLGNKDIPEKIFNKYKTLGTHKVVEYGFGGQVGTILSTVSPFLNLIPGAGTIAAPIAGMAGTVLQSMDQNSQTQNRHGKSPYLQPLPNNYSKTGYESGGIIINEGNGIEHAYGNSHEEGGIQYNQGAEIEGGEKVLDNNYVLTDQPDSNLDKTQISIAKRFDKDHKAISNRNSNAVIDKAKEYLKQDAIMKNEKYLQVRHQKMMDKIGKVVKKYGGDLESLSAELGVYQEGGRGIWGTPMNQRQQTTTFDPSQVPVYLDRYKAALPNTQINNNKSHSGNSQYQDIYPRYQDALYPEKQTSINQPLSQGIQQYDTPDYDTRPNNINSRRLPANTPNKTNTRTGTKVNKAVMPVEVPQQMNPIQVQNVNNQRISSNQDSGFRFYQDPGSQLYPAVPGGNYSGSYTDPYRQSVPERVNQSPENGIPYRYNDQMNSSSSNQPSSFNYGRLAETIGTYAPGIYNLARGLFDKPDYMNSADYTIPQQQANLIPTNTGENEIRDAYTRSLYDMRNSGAYSKLGQVNLANQRAKNNYERKLQLASANAQIRNQVASQNSNINAQNAQMKQNVYDWNARSRAQKGNFVGQGISDLSTGIQNERNYRNDLTGIYSSFDNPTTRNYLESIGYRVPNRYKRGQ